MDLHCEKIIQEYEAQLPTYTKLQEIVLKKLRQIPVSLGIVVNSVESRIKSRDSLIGKLELKGYKYKTIKDITDIFGARIVTFYNDDIDKIARVIEKSFDIDWNNSVDKRKNIQIDQFGYMSLHYICSIPTSLFEDSNYPLINQIKFEIQVRTTLQHVWATIYHDTGYKTDIEVPKVYLRSLNRLAGLLEIADEEFNKIKTSLNDYRRKVKTVVESGNFDEVELNGDSYNAYVKIGGFASLTNRIKDSTDVEIQELSLAPFLSVFVNLFSFKTLGDLHHFKNENAEDAYKLTLRIISDAELDIITSFTPLINLCAVALTKMGGGAGVISLVFEMIYGKRKSNAASAQHLQDLCKQMGIGK